MKKILLALVVVSLLAATSIIPTTVGIFYKDVKSSSFNEARFDRYMKLLMRIGHMPSLAVCCVKDDEVVFSRAYGVYDRENNKVATENTIYLAYSVSKTVTATAMMQIIENESYGIDLDDDVSKWLPFDLKNPNYPDVNITFRMLLAHQSSLNEDYYFGQLIPGDIDIPSYPDPFLQDFLLPNGNLYTPDVWSKDRPGEVFHYSNTGYGVIGYLTERISGQSFEEYCKEHIFIPLNMYNTSFRLGDLDINQAAVPYEYYRRQHFRLLHYGVIPRACGNLRTTVGDLSHFLIAHMNGGVYDGVRILEEDTVELMHRIQYPGNKNELYSFPLYYGLGFEIITRYPLSTRNTIIGHHGWCQARMWLRPSDNTGVIFFTHAISQSLSWDRSINSKVMSQINALAQNLVQNTLFRLAKNS